MGLPVVLILFAVVILIVCVTGEETSGYNSVSGVRLTGFFFLISYITTTPPCRIYPVSAKNAAWNVERLLGC